MGWGWGTLVECPIDFLKTQLQIQIIKSKIDPTFVPEYKGLGDVLKKVMKNNGIKGIYQGFVPHLIRNVPAGAMHIGTFEYVRLKSSEYEKVAVKDLPIKYSILGGALGGLLYWGPIFPVDVVKSSIQADSIEKSNKKYKGVVDTIKKLYAEGGIKRFYKGFSPCILRAVPANSVLLLTASYLSEHL